MAAIFITRSKWYRTYKNIGPITNECFGETLRFAAGEAGDHGDELAGADGFGDVHLVAGGECLTSIDVSGVCSERGGRRLATFVTRQRSHLAYKTVAIFVRHRDIAQDHVRLPFHQLRQCLMR